ncbi:hypothetical protein [Clostridium estertheticum]|uniref:hypothetical protein n=1 Tax=Clostridium estertheticum TaxID=238834 RepID=UPI001C7CD843|nr:hypothetical protein [Clostridium estertheticum]MBX4271777.1 hypothetical protein [Clostridium estertheticum]MCB2356890.1 hypothetical protein [Clostridium estertheticum]WAG44009.1 hypothetical protein LL065_25905 [Clostridium estertheticum]WLC82481.1 hypothetical protein KTC98_24260 [Clostridium estertheticum]
MTNKFDKAIQNRSFEILDSGKKQKTEDVVVSVENKALKQTGFNLDDIIEKTSKNFKNKTYYLETNATNELKKIAKKQNISESKLVNDILKHVLGIK